MMRTVDRAPIDRFLGILGVLPIGAIGPGPSFVVVSKSP